MANSRLELHEKLVELLGSRNVYFQPPENIKLKYPCIIYSFETVDVKKGNNKNYKKKKAYSLMLIHTDPDNEIYDKLVDLLYCSLNNNYTSDNLYHYSFTLYY